MNPLEILIKQKHDLLEEKNKCEDKITELSKLILSLNNSIYTECGKIGHEYVTEIENCMYGETYIFCKTCGLYK